MGAVQDLRTLLSNTTGRKGDDTEACAKRNQELPPKAPPPAKPLLPLPDQGKQSLSAKVKQLLGKEYPKPIVLSKLVAMVRKNPTPVGATEPDNGPMSVHVGNVSGDTTQESLEKKFAEFGTVKRVNLKENINHRRYAFVEFTSANSVQKSIDASRDAGIRVDDRALMVAAASSLTDVAGSEAKPPLFQPSAKVWFEQRADEFRLEDRGSGMLLVRLQQASTQAEAQGQKKRQRSDPDDKSARPADTDAVSQVTRVLLSQRGRHGPSMRLSDLLKALDCCHLKPTPEAWLGRHEDKFQMKALSSAQGRLYISNISTEHRARANLAPDTALQSVFEEFGKVKDIRFGTGNKGKERSSQSPTIAFVDFLKPSHAEMALEAASKDPGIRFGGQKLHVQKARGTSHHDTIVSLVEGGGGERASKKRRSELSAAGAVDHDGADDPLKLERLKDEVRQLLRKHRKPVKLTDFSKEFGVGRLLPSPKKWFERFKDEFRLGLWEDSSGIHTVELLQHARSGAEYSDEMSDLLRSDSEDDEEKGQEDVIDAAAVAAAAAAAAAGSTTAAPAQWCTTAGAGSSSGGGGGDSGGGGGTTGATAAATKPRKPKPMCDTAGWTVKWNAHYNEWFFHNMQTKESTWIAPGNDLGGGGGFSWKLGRALEIVPSRGFAFIEEVSRDPYKRLRGRADQHFCHMKIPRFRQLVEGQLIEFKLRQSTKKKGKTEVGELRAARVQFSE